MSKNAVENGQEKAHSAARSKSGADKVSSNELGKRSIFYDPEWNPEGRPPLGLANVAYNAATFMPRKPVQDALAGLQEIPTPSGK
ncbi:LAMI_0E07338g1_1 [Lachancea mirantina]|uniref:LAMI_0E07338g1_1 n=1 Tax=Lachancea mirantina TaxID=1230905 RepID=A0A1G4JME5_9SACH|nr:LAMI_0E07338g1_1 [Lachancea mirantina]